MVRADFGHLLKESAYDENIREWKTTGTYDGSFGKNFQSLAGEFKRDEYIPLRFDSLEIKDGPFNLLLVAKYFEVSDSKTSNFENGIRIRIPLIENDSWQRLNQILASEIGIDLKRTKQDFKKIRQRFVEQFYQGQWQFPDIPDIGFASRRCDMGIYTSSLVSISCLDSLFVNGSAHESYSIRTKTFKLDESGSPVEIKLDEIVNLTPQNVEKITEVIVSKLIKQGASYPESKIRSQVIDGLQDGTLKTVWTPKGLLIQFAPYEVGSFGEGEYSSLIPYYKIGPMMQPNVPPFFKGTIW